MARDPRIRATIEADGKQATQEIGRVRRAFGGLIVTLGDVGDAIGGTGSLIAKAFREIRAAINLEAQTIALRNQLNTQGQSLDQYIEKLQEVSDGTISAAELIKQSSAALLLGIPAGQIAELLEVARASAVALGLETSSAFDSLALGVARGSKKLLDNLGIIIDVEQAYADFAASIGASTEALTEQQRIQAIADAALAKGQAAIAAAAGTQDGLRTAIDRTTTAISDFQDEMAKVVARSPGVGTALNFMADAAVELKDAFIDLELFGDPVAKAQAEIEEELAKEAAAARKASDELDTLAKNQFALELATKSLLPPLDLVAGQMKELEEVAKTLGITLDRDLVEEIEKVESAMQVLEERFRFNLISQREFDEGMENGSDTLRRLRGEMSGTAEVLDVELVPALKASVDGFVSVEAAAKAAGITIREYTEAALAAAGVPRVFGESNLGRPPGLPITIGQGEFTISDASNGFLDPFGRPPIFSVIPGRRTGGNA